MQDIGEQAVSPVVGVILMVAVTVVLSATVGIFVFDLGQQATTSQSSDLGVTFSSTDGTVTAQIVTGTADTVQLLIDGEPRDRLSDASPGDTLSAAAPADADVTVVSVTDGQRTVVQSTTVDAATVVGPTRGLIAYWRLNENATADTAVDAIGTADGAISGADYIRGVREDALGFNGGSDEVAIDSPPASLPAGASNRTAAAWIYPRNGGNGNIIAWGDGLTNNKRFSILIDANQVGVIGENNDLKFYGAVPNQTWSHVAVTYDGATTTIYINGSAVTSGSFTYDTNGSMPVMLGTNTDNRDDEYFDGRIDDARIYNASLSADEVSRLYNETK